MKIKIAVIPQRIKVAADWWQDNVLLLARPIINLITSERLHLWAPIFLMVGVSTLQSAVILRCALYNVSMVGKKASHRCIILYDDTVVLRSAYYGETENRRNALRYVRRESAHAAVRMRNDWMRRLAILSSREFNLEKCDRLTATTSTWWRSTACSAAESLFRRWRQFFVVARMCNGCWWPSAFCSVFIRISPNYLTIPTVISHRRCHSTNVCRRPYLNYRGVVVKKKNNQLLHHLSVVF